MEPALEPCPKWTALLDILKEIRDDIKHADLDQCHVLIAAEDDRTCNQIREVVIIIFTEKNNVTKLSQKFAYNNMIIMNKLIL